MIGLPTELASAVVASPGDDAPRLACADWLDEAGRADEAAFVRMQVRLAAGASVPLAERRAMEEAAAARLAPLVAECPADGFAFVFERGFANTLRLDHTLTPGLLRALASYPTLARLLHTPDPGIPASTVEPADLRLLAAIPGLSAAIVELATPDLEWAHLEPLLALPRLDTLSVTHDGRELVSGALRRRWTVARSKAAGARAGGDAVEAARAAFGRDRVAELPSGGLAVLAVMEPGRAALLAALPGLRALELRGDALPRQLAGLSELRSLHLRLSGRPAFRPADWRGLAGLRELDIDWDAARPDWGGLLECLAGLRELRVLRFAHRNRAAGQTVAPLPPLPELRVLETAVAGPNVDLNSTRWPAPLEWRHSAWESAFDHSDPRNAPELRLLAAGTSRAWARPAGGWGRRFPTDDRLDDAVHGALSADARREEIPGEGVSLRVPGWFADAPVPPPDPRRPELVPLAAWREWDGDDLATAGRLDRVAHGAGSVAPPVGRERTHFAHVERVTVRWAWRAGGRSYRLTWEGGPGRLLSPEAVAAFTGGSLGSGA